MGPYEPLAMKPRTWEHKSEAASPNSLSLDLHFMSALPGNGLVPETDAVGTQA